MRIHCYEQRLQFGCVRTKLFQSHADVVERRRTRIRAGRVTEEDEEPLAAIRLIADVFAVRCNKCKRPTNCCRARCYDLGHRAHNAKCHSRRENADSQERGGEDDQKSKSALHLMPLFPSEGEFFSPQNHEFPISTLLAKAAMQLWCLVREGLIAALLRLIAALFGCP